MISKIKAATLISVLLASFSSSGQDTQRSYQFTQAFSSCVKGHQQEAYNAESAGAAMSGLMNGQSLSESRTAMDSRYWQYMNCLNQGVSGTRQQAVPVAKTCSPNGKLPAGVEGKKFSYKGSVWSCQDGNWSSHGGSAPDNGGDYDDSNNKPCAGITVTEGACSVELPDMVHGKSSVANQTLWASSAFYTMNVTASCSNGQVEVHKKECVKQSCSSGEKVTWFSTSVNGTERCEGNVDNSGEAEHSAPSTFYRSLIEAKRMSNAKIGEASFICENNAWKLTGGSCRAKLINELICSERIGLNNTLEYSCK